MYRRRFLGAMIAGGSLTGCLGGRNGPPGGSTATPTKTTTPTPIQQTADAATATFKIVDSHAPTPDSVQATFGGTQVTVTGSMDPESCNRPTLSSVSYDVPAETVELIIKGKSPYAASQSVECGNASFEYRSVVSIDEGRVSTVDVTHEYATGDDRTFRRTRA